VAGVADRSAARWALNAQGQVAVPLWSARARHPAQRTVGREQVWWFLVRCPSQQTGAGKVKRAGRGCSQGWCLPRTAALVALG
jgi:hypothetical protein